MKKLSLGLSGISAAILLVGGLACSSEGGSSTGNGGTSPAGGKTGASGGSASGGVQSPGSGGTTSASGGSSSGGAAGSGTSGGASGSSSTNGGSSSGGAAHGGSGTSGAAGSVAKGGATSMGGANAGGAAPMGGAAGSSSAGAAGSSGGDCSSAAGVISYPKLPGASESPLYTVTANGAAQFVEKLTKFAPEMQVHYAYFGVATGCKANISVTLKDSFTNFKLSPKSRNLAATKSGNTITFTSGPNYLILAPDSKELLFILIDDQEVNPPKLGDANVKNIADSMVDNTGATIETTKIQAAINAASGATQNILYFPPGRYKTGELSMKSNMTLYLAAGSILDGSTKTSDYAAAGPAVEQTSHGVLHFNNVENAKVLGPAAA